MLFISSCRKPLKTDLERCVPAPVVESLFYQTHTLKTLMPATAQLENVLH